MTPTIRTHDEQGHALYGEVIHTRPTPAEMEANAAEVAAIRRSLCWLRSQVETLGDRYAYAFGRQIRDAEGLLTAALSFLYPLEEKLPEWAANKRRRRCSLGADVEQCRARRGP